MNRSETVNIQTVVNNFKTKISVLCNEFVNLMDFLLSRKSDNVRSIGANDGSTSI
jgi:hypothetical protein